MNYELWIPGRLPLLNELMLNRGRRIRAKKEWMATICVLASAARIPRVERCSIAFHIKAPNLKADPDGMAAGAMKVVLDALQHAGVLPNDGWRNIAGLSFTWELDRASPGTLVTITPVDTR